MTLRAVPKSKKAPKRRSKVAPSIMQDKKECFITGATQNLHRHEVFFGTDKRQKSLEWGCWVYLRGDLHNQSKRGVHFNAALDKQLKQLCQRHFEKLYGADKFREVFGKSYL